jgi:hypothetical protein
MKTQSPQSCAIDDNNFETFVNTCILPLSILTSKQEQITFSHVKNNNNRRNWPVSIMKNQVYLGDILTYNKQMEEIQRPALKRTSPYVLSFILPDKKLVFKGHQRRRRKFGMPEDQYTMVFSLSH